jgi:predicted lipoprotein
MLVEYRDVFIKPAFNNALQKAEALELAASTFITNPSTEQLAPVQNAWIDAAIAWQSACWYNFGPAGEAGIKKSIQEEIATFPVSLTKLNTILTSGTWNLNDFNRDARGFFAIEYLLFDASLTPEQVSERFQNDVYRNFLNALCLDLKTRILEVKNAWNSYGSEFTSNAGTDAGSSVSMMYNEFVKSYEGLKNFKFGLPLGLRPGQTAVDPTLLEARFSRISFRLARAHYNALVNFYRGVDQTKSFKGYLKTVTGGEALVTTTEAQLSVLNTQFNNLDENLDMETRILNDPQALIDIHTELQKNTKNFKSDMSSLLGIAITYASGDGD